MIETMDGEAVNEYLDKVIAGKIKVADPLEAKAVEQFRRCSSRVDTFSANLRRAENQVEQIKSDISSANGEMKAYANILGEAEDARRKIVQNEAEQAAKDASDRQEAEDRVHDEKVKSEAGANETSQSEPAPESEEASPLHAVEEPSSEDDTAAAVN